MNEIDTTTTLAVKRQLTCRKMAAHISDECVLPASYRTIFVVSLFVVILVTYSQRENYHITIINSNNNYYGPKQQQQLAQYVYQLCGAPLKTASEATTRAFRGGSLTQYPAR